MNIPNTITSGRLILAILFFGLMTWYLRLEGPEGPGDGGAASWLLDVAVAVFLVAALSDWLDGYVARRLNLTTTFGRIADPLVDKIIVGGAFVYMIGLGSNAIVKPWMVVLILAREFLVTGLRSYAESQGKAFGALLWGKVKMWVQCVTIITFLVYIGHFDGVPWASTLTQVTVYATLIATAGSALPYLRKATVEIRAP